MVWSGAFEAQDMGFDGWRSISAFRFSDKSVFHLLDNLVKEDIGDLRMEGRFELKGYVEINHARLRDILEALAKAPNCQEVAEQPAIDAFGLDKARTI